jgi:hypothetical protein
MNPVSPAAASLALLLAGCSTVTKPKGPSDAEITQQVVNDVKNCHAERSPSPEILGIKPIARSVEGTSATVIVEIDYRYVASHELMWGDLPCAAFNGRKTGERALTQIKIKYKEYDTGWRVGGYPSPR